MKMDDSSPQCPSSCLLPGIQPRGKKGSVSNVSRVFWAPCSHAVLCPPQRFLSQNSRPVDKHVQREPVLFCKLCVYFSTLSPHIQSGLTSRSVCAVKKCKNDSSVSLQSVKGLTGSARGRAGRSRFPLRAGITSHKHHRQSFPGSQPF